MIRVAHLLDDFALGGVTRALSLFDDPGIKARAVSRTVPIGREERVAPRLDADMIVLHVPPSWKNLPFLATLRLRNPAARIVHVEHSYTRAFETLNVVNRGRFRALLRIAASLVNEIVAVSHDQRRWLAETGIPAEKITTIHPWCGRFDLADVPDITRRDKPLRLLAYGRFSEEKNFAALVNAMKDFSASEACLTLFGDGPDGSMLHARARDCPNVRLMPASPDPAPYLAACDAVIVPSRREAFGLVATEARMAGRAVLTSTVDGLPEQVLNGGGFCVPAATSDEIAAGIRSLFDVDLVAMGAAARLSVASQHDEIIAGWHAVIGRAACRTVPRKSTALRLLRA